MTVLPGTPRFGGVPYRAAGVDTARLFGRRSLFSRIPTGSWVLTPQHIARSDFNLAHTGPAQVLGYDGLRSLIRQTARLLRRHREPKYVYVYWPELDSIGHHHGMASQAAADHLRILEAALEDLLDRIAGSDTLAAGLRGPRSGGPGARGPDRPRGPPESGGLSGPAPVRRGPRRLRLPQVRPGGGLSRLLRRPPGGTGGGAAQPGASWNRVISARVPAIPASRSASVTTACFQPGAGSSASGCPSRSATTSSVSTVDSPSRRCWCPSACSTPEPIRPCLTRPVGAPPRRETPSPEPTPPLMTHHPDRQASPPGVESPRSCICGQDPALAPQRRDRGSPPC